MHIKKCSDRVVTESCPLLCSRSTDFNPYLLLLTPRHANTDRSLSTVSACLLTAPFRHLKQSALNTFPWNILLKKCVNPYSQRQENKQLAMAINSRMTATCMSKRQWSPDTSIRTIQRYTEKMKKKKTNQNITVGPVQTLHFSLGKLWGMISNAGTVHLQNPYRRFVSFLLRLAFIPMACCTALSNCQDQSCKNPLSLQSWLHHACSKKDLGSSSSSQSCTAITKSDTITPGLLPRSDASRCSGQGCQGWEGEASGCAYSTLLGWACNPAPTRKEMQAARSGCPGWSALEEGLKLQVLLHVALWLINCPALQKRTKDASCLVINSCLFRSIQETSPHALLPLGGKV